MEQYRCQISLPEIGFEGQKKLQQASILVIGIGGLGCAALPYLAASGIRTIGLIDFDRVEMSNLARQTLFAPSDLGACKTNAAISRLRSLYPETRFQPQMRRLNAENAQELIELYDLVIDATDNLPARLAIDDACRSLKKPWIYGSIYQWEGQVALFTPKTPGYRFLFPSGESAGHPPSCAEAGVLGPFVGLVGMIQAIEAIKTLSHAKETLAGKLLRIDGREWRFSRLSFATFEPELARISHTISSKGVQDGASDLFFPGRKHCQNDKESPGKDKDDATDCADLPRECEKCGLEISQGQIALWGSQAILIDATKPLSREQLDSSKKIVAYCPGGRRSLALAHRLRQEGFDAYSIRMNTGRS